MFKFLSNLFMPQKGAPRRPGMYHRGGIAKDVKPHLYGDNLQPLYMQMEDVVARIEAGQRHQIGERIYIVTSDNLTQAQLDALKEKWQSLLADHKKLTYSIGGTSRGGKPENLLFLHSMGQQVTLREPFASEIKRVIDEVNYCIDRIREQTEDEKSGFWTSCTGCHECNEGHPTGRYSTIFKCHIGLGCHECGGIGAIWDNEDVLDDIKPLPDQEPAAWNAATQPQHPDYAAVDAFADKMKEKLAKKRADGRGGWEDKTQCTAELLSQLLRDHVNKGDPVDVANLAMMLSMRGEGITQHVKDTSDVRLGMAYITKRSKRHCYVVGFVVSGEPLLRFDDTQTFESLPLKMLIRWPNSDICSFFPQMVTQFTQPPTDAQKREALDALERISMALVDPHYTFDTEDLSKIKSALQSPAAPVDAEVRPVGYVISTYLDERKSEYERNGTVMYSQPCGMATTPLYRAATKPVVPREVETLWLLAEQCSTHFGNGIDHTKQINKTLAILGGKEG